MPSNIQCAYSVSYNHLSEMTLTEMFDWNIVQTTTGQLIKF